MEIAPHHPERQRVTTRMHMVERLLLNRIALQARDVAERDAQLAALVEAHPANPVASRADETAVPAGDTANPFSLGSPQRSNRRVLAEHIRQRFAGRTGLHRRGSRSGSDSWLRVPSYVLHKAEQELTVMLRGAGFLSKPEQVFL